MATRAPMLQIIVDRIHRLPWEEAVVLWEFSSGLQSEAVMGAHQREFLSPELTFPVTNKQPEQIPRSLWGTSHWSVS